MVCLRLSLAIVVAMYLELCQLDIDTMLMYAPIKEDVYIRQHFGFTDGTLKLRHLKRCLNSVKHSLREFNTMLRDWKVDKWWQECICIFVFRTGGIFTMIVLYVDDIPAACNYTSWLALFKARLGATFKIKGVGDLSQMLGMHITHDRPAHTISLDQSKYMKYNMANHITTELWR
jgi:hypothetical protein